MALIYFIILFVRLSLFYLFINLMVSTDASRWNILTMNIIYLFQIN